MGELRVLGEFHLKLGGCERDAGFFEGRCVDRDWFRTQGGFLLKGGGGFGGSAGLVGVEKRGGDGAKIWVVVGGKGIPPLVTCGGESFTWIFLCRAYLWENWGNRGILVIRGWVWVRRGFLSGRVDGACPVLGAFLLWS